MVIAVVYFVVAVGAAVFFGRALDRQVQGPRLRAAWAEGLTAEARCVSVRTEEVEDADGVPFVRVHLTLEFRTADGRTVSFEEHQARPGPAEGDFVTVHYSAQSPEAATTRPPAFAPRHLRALITVVGGAFALATAAVLAAVL
ncbi:MULTISPECIES: DUF3592 domain-containing protein [unclassified Streptomyces]|uniref:DUF3592 domain-containing protein n=1 Tax=unclassified Streptomyces TaxID=2593676 RepID=UPI0036EB61C0